MDGWCSDWHVAQGSSVAVLWIAARLFANCMGNLEGALEESLGSFINELFAWFDENVLGDAV